MNVFLTGLDKDSAKRLVAEGQYTDAVNAVLNNEHYNNMYSLANEQGFTVYGDFHTKKPGNLIVGLCNSGGDIIIFSITVDSQLNTLSSEIGIIINGNYKTILNDKDPIYWEGLLVNNTFDLNFNINNQISCETRYNNENKRVVYFIDGLNYNRFINIDTDYTIEKFYNIDIQTRLIDTPEYPIIKFTSISEGGSIRPGVYQFCARYKNRNLDPTEFGAVCNIIPIIDEPEDTTNKVNADGANFDYPKISKSINISISNIDKNYKYIDVAVIYYSGASSDFNAAIFTSVEIQDYTMDFTFTGAIKETVLLEDIVQIKPKYKTAQHHTQKDGIYIQANLTVLPTLDIQAIANKVTIGYKIREEDYYITNDAPANSGVFTATGDTELIGDDSFCFKVPAASFANKTYNRGEAYSFGLVFTTLEGDSFVAHIPGFYDKDSEFIPNTDSTSGKRFGSGNRLGTYFSELKYKEKGVYFGRDVNGNIIDLYNTSIRHHLMPDYSKEPIFSHNPGISNFKFKYIYLELFGLKSALALYPEIYNRVKSITLVRQERNIFTNKSVYAQGFGNPLLKQDGKIKTSSNVRAHYQGDYADNDFQTTYNAESGDLATTDFSIPSYIINPICGNTHIHDYNSACFMNGRIPYIFNDDPTDLDKKYFESGFGEDGGNAWAGGGLRYSGSGINTQYLGYDCNVSAQLPPDLTGFSGQSNDPVARKSVAFFSPETTILKSDFQIPLGAKLRKIAVLKSYPYRIIPDEYLITNYQQGTDALPEGSRLSLQVLSLGSYANIGQFPFSFKMRSPFFHLYFSYTRLVRLFSYKESLVNRKTILIKQITEHNDVVKLKEDLQALPNIVPGSNYKLNNYDSEGFTMFTLDDELFDSDFTPKRIYVILGGTIDSDKSGSILDQIYRYIDIDGNVNLTNYTFSAQNEIYLEDPSYTFESKTTSKSVSGMRPIRYKSPSIDDAESYDRILYNVETENKTQYSELESSRYIPVKTWHNPSLVLEKGGDLISFDSDTLSDIYNGDTFLGKFAYRNSMRLYYRFYRTLENGFTRDINLDAAVWNKEDDGKGATAGNQMQGGFLRISQKDGAELRALNFYPVESQINMEYRHRVAQVNTDGEITGFGVPYFPKSSALEVLSYESELGESTAYNIQYSKENTIKPYFSKPFGFTEITSFTNRVIHSQKSLEGEQSDQYRVFLTNDYQDIPKHKGEITNLFVFNNNLYSHTERSLFQMSFNRQEMITGDNKSAIFLGTGSVFSTPPIEIYPIQGGYCGSLHKWATVSTPFGVLFVDKLQGKVFRFDGQSVVEATKGMYNFFLTNLKSNNNNTINPLGTGVLGAYDPIYKRVILCIRNTGGIFDYNNTELIAGEYKTVSYSLESSTWTSLHDYDPACMLTLDNKLYSVRNTIFDNENSLFLHNTGTPGIYYNSDIIHPFIIEFVVNAQAGQSKVFDNLFIVCESYDSNNVKQLIDFFNTGEFWTDYQHAGLREFKVRDPRLLNVDEFTFNVSLFNNQFQLPVPYSKTTNNFENLFELSNQTTTFGQARLRDKFMNVRLVYKNNDGYYFVLHYIDTKTRLSLR